VLCQAVVEVLSVHTTSFVCGCFLGFELEISFGLGISWGVHLTCSGAGGWWNRGLRLTIISSGSSLPRMYYICVMGLSDYFEDLKSIADKINKFEIKYINEKFHDKDYTLFEKGAQIAQLLSLKRKKIIDTARMVRIYTIIHSDDKEISAMGKAILKGMIPIKKVKV
jgi:hypothetical protein